MLAYPKTDARVLLVVGLGVLAAVLAAIALAGGTPVRMVGVAVLIASPVLVYLALEHPILFPYGLYIALMPYDVLLTIHANSSLTKALGAAAGIICLFYCLRARYVAPVRQPLIVLLLLLLWMSLSALWSVSWDATMLWLPSYYALALLYGALSLTPLSLKDFNVTLGIVAVSFVVAAIFGIHTFYHDPAFRPMTYAQQQRLSLKLGDTQIDQNHFANAFLFPIAILITTLIRTNWLTLKMLCAGGIGLMVTAMFMSGSREATLALLVMVGYFFWRGRNRVQLLAMTGICAFGALPFSTAIVARFSGLFVHQQYGEPRAEIWSVGFAAMKHYWMLGSGVGTFPQVYNRFYLAVAQFRPDGWERPAHDLIIHYTVELGIVGMALVAWFFIANFTMLRGIGRDHPLHDYRVMIEAAMIGIVIVSLFIDLFTYKYAWLVFASASQVTYLGSTMRRRSRGPSPERAAEAEGRAYGVRKITSKSFGVRLDANAP